MKQQTQPFKLTIEQHGITVAVSYEHSDIDMEQLVEAVRGVICAVGWNFNTFADFAQERAREG